MKVWIGEGTKDTKVSLESVNKTYAEVLDRLSRWSSAVWWVDRYDTLHFGPSETDEHVLDEPYNHVIDTDAGKQTPPYRSVKVIGDGVVSNEGWESRRPLSDEAEVASGSIPVSGGGVDTESTTTTEEPLEEPVFVYKSKEIKTYEQARNTRDRILKELQEQQANGWVEMVGRPNVGVLDVIRMPESFGRTNVVDGEVEELDPAVYLVETIVHRFNSDDGFITRVECGGVAGQ